MPYLPDNDLVLYTCSAKNVDSCGRTLAFRIIKHACAKQFIIHHHKVQHESQGMDFICSLCCRLVDASVIIGFSPGGGGFSEPLHLVTQDNGLSADLINTAALMPERYCVLLAGN